MNSELIQASVTTKGTRKTLTLSALRYSNWIYLPLSLCLVLVAWEVVNITMQPPSYVLPSPSRVLTSLMSGMTLDINNRAGWLYHLSGTMYGTFLGFAIGSTIGIIIGSLLSEIPILERLAYPYVVGLQSLPKVALAPLIVLWFGFGMESKLAMAALITFFPLIINCMAGLKAVEAERIELMRSLSSNRWQIFWLVKFPSALPFIFAGINMAVVYALLGTIVAEFVGAQRGMGVQILLSESVNDTASIFAALLILGFVGIVLSFISRAIERRVVFWVYREEAIVTA